MNAPRITKSALCPIGLELRTIRVKRSLRLADLALRLGYSPAYLSAIEIGRKPLPPELIDELENLSLDLSPDEMRSLRRAATLSSSQFVVQADSPEAKMLAAAFAKKVNKLTVQQIRELLRSYFAYSTRDPRGRYRYDKWVLPKETAEIFTSAKTLYDGANCKIERATPIVELIDVTLSKLFPDQIGLHIVDDDFLPPDVLALTSLWPPAIVVAESIYLAAVRDDPLGRWILAHELGHYWLAHGLDMAFAPTKRSVTQIRLRNSAEYQADQFAAEFLMPREPCLSMSATDISRVYKVSEYVAKQRLSFLHSQ